jgi:hypothetical protein
MVTPLYSLSSLEENESQFTGWMLNYNKPVQVSVYTCGYQPNNAVMRIQKRIESKLE